MGCFHKREHCNIATHCERGPEAYTARMGKNSRRSATWCSADWPFRDKAVRAISAFWTLLFIRTDGFVRITGARKHRESRVLREIRIRRGKLAHPKHRSALGFNAPRVHAIATQACI